MLYDYACRLVKRLNALNRRIRVGNVVVAKGLALVQCRCANSRFGGIAIGVERRVLMRVLAVAHD